MITYPESTYHLNEELLKRIREKRKTVNIDKLISESVFPQVRTYIPESYQQRANNQN